MNKTKAEMNEIKELPDGTKVQYYIRQDGKKVRRTYRPKKVSEKVATEMEKFEKGSAVVRDEEPKRAPPKAKPISVEMPKLKPVPVKETEPEPVKEPEPPKVEEPLWTEEEIPQDPDTEKEIQRRLEARKAHLSLSI